MTSQLDAWERAALPHEEHPGVLPHRRSSSLMPTTADRMLELGAEVQRLREMLLEACGALRGLDRERRELWEQTHTMKSSSFGGVVMAQIPADLQVWEALLNENPALTGIIEIGTWEGGFSGWLWAQARIRGIHFWTVDAVAPERLSRAVVPWREDFERFDVFANPEIVREQILYFGEPMLLFCDGGNKPRELREFATLLRNPASLILVHDWGTETNPEDVPAGLVPVYEDFLDGLGSITRAFRPGGQS